MKAVITFRPKADPDQLRKIAKNQHYPDLSAFINDAIEEKIRNIHANPKDEKLVNDIKKAVYDYNGWVFAKPTAQESSAIKKRAEAMRLGKEKSIPLADVIKRLERMK